MNGAAALGTAPAERLDDGRRYRRIEELDLFCPLGLRFWDPVLDRPVGEGLLVSAWPLPAARPVTRAFRTRSGVYAFQRLPGLGPVERPSASDNAPSAASPPGGRPFVVEVVDTRRRFLPAAVEIELPLPYRGVFLAQGPGAPASRPVLRRASSSSRRRSVPGRRESPPCAASWPTPGAAGRRPTPWWSWSSPAPPTARWRTGRGASRCSSRCLRSKRRCRRWADRRRRCPPRPRARRWTTAPGRSPSASSGGRRR